MQQLSFVESLKQERSEPEVNGCGLPTPRTTRLLDVYRERRHLEGAGVNTIKRETSQLRSIARESEGLGGPRELADLFADLRAVAQVLCTPTSIVARSTNRTRLIAAQRFIRFLSELSGQCTEKELARLESLLPAERSAGWQSTGTLVAGTTHRRRPSHPTLDAQDLHRILYSAKSGSTRGTRDLAIVALHCFSGLRPEEIAALDWNQIEVARQGEGYQALCVAVDRGDQTWRLPLPRRSATALVQFADSLDAQIEYLHGPVFKRSASVDQPLSYRAIRDVVGRACDRAGLPIVEAVDLRAAFAHWLRSRGLSDHEVARVLGVQRVRTVDRLLRRHRALDAQRRVRETQSR